ncbi:MAG TPA: CNNM domain-containing protein, partial [Acidimicrobiales bacterium]|nr:CNNM domain-containing protein [Acidimicrobiales bacterium]
MAAALLLADSGSRFRATDWILIGVVLLLLAVSAALALSETSLVRMSRTKAMALEDEGRRGAGSLLRLVQDPEGFLNPILLLVLISQLVTATLVGILADRWFGPVGVIAATVFEVVVIFVLAEALPKNWAVQNPERSALMMAPVVSFLVRSPPIRLVS